MQIIITKKEKTEQLSWAEFERKYGKKPLERYYDDKMLTARSASLRSIS